MSISDIAGRPLRLSSAVVALWDGDGSYSGHVTVADGKTVTLSGRVVSAIQEGYGSRTAQYSEMNGGTVRLVCSQAQMDLIALLLGQTYSVTGSTPNQIGALRMYRKTIPYVGLAWGVDNDEGTANAVHGFVPKAKITANTVALLSAIGEENPNYGDFEIELEIFPDAQYNSGQASEVQNLALGSPSTGNFTLSFGGETTASLAYNASAGDIETALEALNNIGTGNVTVTTGTDFVLTFGGTLANKNLPLLTGTGDGTFDGTIAITQTTPGSAGNDLLADLYSVEAGTSPTLPPALV